MQVLENVADFRAARHQLTGTLGLVPTMGFLHAGHVALIQQAQAENDHVAVSIFVNPTQFNNANDLATYPRDMARDLALLREHGVALVFAPPADVMYPAGFQTYIEVEQVSQGLEGEHRPGHFRGVATVVSKLFNIVQPDRAYFGQKDAQQVAVIRQMVRDLDMPLVVVVCPIVREADGLAMSSRNAKLSPNERQAATVLYRALSAAQTDYENGERDPKSLRETMQAVLSTEKRAQIDYVSVADADTLQEQQNGSERPLLLSMAVWIGNTRLIDNLVVGM